MLKKFIALSVLAIASMPACATDYWLVFAYGNKPNRHMVYVNRDTWSKDLDVLASNAAGKEIQQAQIDATIVFESVNEPDEMNISYRINCTQRTLYGQPYLLWRNTDKQAGYSLPASDKKIVEERIMEFSCNEKSQTIDAGMMKLGATPHMPTELTWTAFWQDGVRPPYTTSKSREQIDTEHAQLMVKVEEHQKMARAMAGGAQQVIAHIDQSMAADAEAAKRKQNRNVNKHYGAKLESWIGQTESALIESWGIPKKSYNADGARFLEYDFGYDESYVNGYGVSMGSQSYHCYVNWTVKNGRILNYRATGNYCRTSLGG